MRLRCIPVTATLSARGARGLTMGMRRHVDRCARCTTEVEAHRVMDEGMRSLRGIAHQAPAEVYPRVMDGIRPWAVPMSKPSSPRRAIVAAVAAVVTAMATAAAGTVVVLVRQRHRTA